MSPECETLRPAQCQERAFGPSWATSHSQGVRRGGSLRFPNTVGGSMKAVVRKTAKVQHRPAPRSNERRSVTQHPRRRILSLAAGAAALPTVSWAQTYPTRPITVIMPFAAGGPGDVLGRIVSEHMSRTLGQLLV